MENHVIEAFARQYLREFNSASEKQGPEKVEAIVFGSRLVLDLMKKRHPKKVTDAEAKSQVIRARRLVLIRELHRNHPRYARLILARANEMMRKGIGA